MYSEEDNVINLYNHGGSANHGCEAIVRSTVSMIGEKCILYSNMPEEDIRYGINKICKVITDKNLKVQRGTISWLTSKLSTKMTGSIDLEIKYRRKGLISNIQRNDLCLSIGGDNYCYPGTEILASVNRNIKKKKGKTILWGCSVSPELISKPDISNDLASFNLIIARETISYDALKLINPNTIMATDPAFTLKQINLPLPENWMEGNMIGINISPLIIKREQNEGIIYEACRRLIREILTNTDLGIALIPHVVWTENDDRIPLQKLFDEFSESNRIVILSDCNCMELKGYIARCRMFIGARTHATIAAYSTCVPTVVLGYSVKSIGIARDLFGTDINYVLPVEEIENGNELIEHFYWLRQNEQAIHRYLTQKMPAYINAAYDAKNALFELME